MKATLCQDALGGVVFKCTNMTTPFFPSAVLSTLPTFL